jgi:D-glutamate N-acetyltransferase
MSDRRQIASPYLLFMGNAQDEVTAKTALGIAHWRREDCVAQAVLPDCKVNAGIPTMTVREAASAGARTLIVGIAPPGGALPEDWIASLVEALECGLDIASGLHVPLQSVAILAETAARTGCRLINVRLPDRAFAVGKGLKRTGKRLLTVGTDCAVGKKYTALAIHRELVSRGVPATFRATGQTGILISGGGVAIDAVVADFVAGAAEWLSPPASDDHWDIIEGQGSLLHPSYAAVSLGLLHGSQADVFVVCHEPTRKTMANTTYPVPAIEEVIDLTLRLGRLTNALIRCVGIAINTSHLPECEARALVMLTSRNLRLPCTDPLRFGASQIVEALP